MTINLKTLAPADIKAAIYVELELCDNIEELNAYLLNGGYAADEYDGQSGFLAAYMGVISTGGFGYISPEAKCVMLKNMFLKGDWRQLTDKYLLASLEEIEKAASAM